MVVENRGDGHPKDTHDGDVVDRHAHVLGVVQGRDLEHGYVESKKLQATSSPEHSSSPKQETLQISEEEIV